MSSCSRSLLADGFRLIVVANMRCNGDAVLVLGALNLSNFGLETNDDYEQMLLKLILTEQRSLYVHRARGLRYENKSRRDSNLRLREER